MKWFKNLFKKKRCEHTRYSLRQWFTNDGTPMMAFHCFDCRFSDAGHVHGDPEQMRKDGWEKEVSVGL